MKIRNQWKGVAVGLVVAGMLAVGLTAFGQEYGGGRRGAGGQGYGGRRDGPGAQQGPRGGGPGQMGRQPAGGMRLLANPDVNVEVQQVEGGVKVLVTSDDVALANQISTQLPNRLEWVTGMRRAGRNVARPEGTPGRGASPGGRQGGPLQDADVDTEPLDNGLAILVTSDDEQTVQVIQRMIPHRIERMRPVASRMRNRQGLRGGVQGAQDGPGNRTRGRSGGQLALGRSLFAEGVDVQVTDTDNGVTLQITTDDPEQVERLQQTLRQRLEIRDALIRRLREQAEIREAGPERPTPGHTAAPSPRRHQVDPEIRETIREEIRRYMEEQEKD